MNDMSTSTLALMERFLDLAARRQTLISQNLAQIDTPGYQTMDIPFEEHMRSLVREVEERSFSSGASAEVTAPLPNPQRVQGLKVRPDRNNVNMDHELTEMMANSAKFAVVTQLLSQKLKLLQSVIREGR